MNIPKKPRGRNGGRNPLVTGESTVVIPISFRRDQAELINSQGNKSAFVRAMIDKALEKENPQP